ncbi:MAG: LCP family protein [Lachnospiraceae bacterium]|nr:LCP family protein [Lachnospiraceae bacterium]
MADDPVLDDMIEILPDEASLEADGSATDDHDGDSDMTIVPDKEDVSALPEDEDMKIAYSGPAETGIKSVPESIDEDADMKIIPEGSSYSDIQFEDDYSREMYEMEHEDDDRDLIEEINASLQEQNRSSIADEERFTRIVLENEPTSFFGKIGAFIKRLPVWAYFFSGIVLLLIMAVILLFTTDIGKKIVINEGSQYVAGKMNYSPVVEEPVVEIPDDLDLDMEPGIEVVDETKELEMPETKKKTVDVEQVPQEKKIHNILLLGEENIESKEGRGRSDLIIIATINEEDKSIKFTSVMRDILVAIPGHSDNRLNAAYAMGGVSLVYQTLGNNLGIDIDNYAKVNFESFEKIIDAIGGVDIKLTEEEASYLNRTNYISNEKYRNVKAGKNHLNGNQALGYCRIRKVGTAGNEYSDFGRTSRHRILLESIVTSIKGMSLKQLKKFCDKCLPYVTTDIDEETLEKYIKAVFDIGLDKQIGNYRIPIDGTYSDANLRGMLVTKVDLRKNALELQKFIYGE